MDIKRIIQEELYRLIKEDYEDDYFEMHDEIKRDMFTDFLYKNNANFTKHIPWRVIPFPRLKKIWSDYMQTNLVRDEKGLEMIKSIMIDNTIKVDIMTNLAGHTEWGDKEALEENIGYFVDEQLNCLYNSHVEDKSQLEIPFDNPKSGYKLKEPLKTEPCEVEIHPYIRQVFNNQYDGDMNRDAIREILYEHMEELFFDYYMEDENHDLGGFISDYGLNPLLTLLGKLLRSEVAEESLVIIDKMLNVVHMRSDIASWFVEGGSDALSSLSGYTGKEAMSSTISGQYKMSDYHS